MQKAAEHAQIPTYFNVSYQLRGADGKVKRLFQTNKLGDFILRVIRKYADRESATKIERNLALYGIRIPLITGRWTEEMRKRNLVTNAGKAGAASRLNGAGAEPAFTYIAMGTGTTAPAAGDTTLQTELSGSGLARANASASRVTTSVTNDTAQLQNTFNVTGTVAVTESGILNASSGGVLLCRQTFSAINVVNGDSLQVTWKVQVS
jgi:osmotically-inducible protein OsmY